VKRSSSESTGVGANGSPGSPTPNPVAPGPEDVGGPGGNGTPGRLSRCVDTLGIALIVVVVVIAIVAAALLHERSQVGTARRNTGYAYAQQVYETRRAIIIAQRTAQIEASNRASSSAARVAPSRGPTPLHAASGAAALLERPGAAHGSGVALPSADAIDAFLDADEERAQVASSVAEGGAEVTARHPELRSRRQRRLQRRRDQDTVPAWVNRPLRPGEDPKTPWWVRLRAMIGIAVVVAIMGAVAAATVGSVFFAASLILERFTG